MNILVVDPKSVIGPKVEPVLRSRNWGCTIVRDMSRAVAALTNNSPDAVVIHGDGPNGEAAHLCQRFKQNVLTAGMPLILVEDSTPPAWLLAGLPADAILQSPWEPDELMHHVEALIPVTTGSGTLDDLTNFPRRAAAIDDIARRLVSRELFGVGVLSLREADAYRQDYGRTGLDQFVVLVSVLLRRHASGSNPVSIGYLEEGSFLVVGSSSVVHQIVAQTTRDFDALVPAYYEMDTLFGKDENHEVGPTTWIGLQGAVCLIEPERFDNILQIGFVLSDTMATGLEAVQISSYRSARDATSGLAAD
jgi:DNA-binding response OmpR family regulator